MTLQEFLSDKTGTAEELQTLAKDYPSVKTGYITANLMNSLLVQNGLTRAMQKIAETDGHPAQNAMLSFFDPRSTDYNFIIGDGTTTGDLQIALLDGLIAAGSALDTVIGGQTIEVAAKFATLKPTLIYLCNTPYKPFENVTLHEVMVAKGLDIPFYSTGVDKNGWLTITTTEDCEKHNPRVLVDIAGQKQRIASIMNVEKAGTYSVKCERGYSAYYVENAYGAIQTGE